MVSRLEDKFEEYLIETGIEYVREYKFIPDRRFRADFYLPSINCLVEIEGGIWGGGRHNRGTGYSKDCDKYNLATLYGYKLLRFTTEHVKLSDYKVLEEMMKE